MTENIILVDSNDNCLGEIEKIEAHKKALLHRAVSVFIFNSENKILLQKRALTKYHSPGLWTNTACTHPNPGESNKAAAERRLKQEMGIAVDNVVKLFHFTYKEKLDDELYEHEFDHVFIAFSDDIPIPNRDEVMDFKYVGMDEILELVRKYPQNYTVWFRAIVERVICDSKHLL